MMMVHDASVRGRSSKGFVLGLVPGSLDPVNAARLLTFFAMTDIHIADKESPAQPIYVRLSAPLIPANAHMVAAYSPCIVATTHVLDAAVQSYAELVEPLTPAMQAKIAGLGAAMQ